MECPSCNYKKCHTFEDMAQCSACGFIFLPQGEVNLVQHNAALTSDTPALDAIGSGGF